MATKFPKPVKTPPVYVDIWRNGNVVDSLKFDDPRNKCVQIDEWR